MDALNFICFSQKDKVCIIISVYNLNVYFKCLIDKPHFIERK